MPRCRVVVWIQRLLPRCDGGHVAEISWNSPLWCSLFLLLTQRETSPQLRNQARQHLVDQRQKQSW
jgi:hypothetical protein